MRDIKFRAWDGKDMLNIDHWTLSMINEHLPKNHIVMQYTGLKDKNGNEIYEGDIVKVNTFPQLMEVYFKKGQFGWGRKFTKSHTFDGFIKEDSIEIIGNIHENPKLLDGLK